MTLTEIQGLTARYAAARARLLDLAGRLDAETEVLREHFMPDIGRAVGALGVARGALYAAIEAAPTLFTRPRTHTFNAIRVGIAKQRGQVEFGDEAGVIARIRALLPDAQAQLLIRVREWVHRPAVYDLSVADLKRLGIRIVDDADAVMIKPVDSALEKLVSALLKEVDTSAALE